MITWPVLTGVPWLFTTTLAFSEAGIRHLPEMVHLIMQGGHLVLGNCTVSWRREAVLAMNQLANRHNVIFYL